jgi:hypothetical protein
LWPKFGEVDTRHQLKELFSHQDNRFFFSIERENPGNDARILAYSHACALFLLQVVTENNLILP